MPRGGEFFRACYYVGRLHLCNAQSTILDKREAQLVFIVCLKNFVTGWAKIEIALVTASLAGY